MSRTNPAAPHADGKSRGFFTCSYAMRLTRSPGYAFGVKLAAELKIWGPLTTKFLLFHDTVSFRQRDEGIGGHGGLPANKKLYSNVSKATTGLRPAINEFVRGSKGEWVMALDRPQCNGLVVLRRTSTTTAEDTEVIEVFGAR
jgi:hypothetical protein